LVHSAKNTRKTRHFGITVSSLSRLSGQQMTEFKRVSEEVVAVEAALSSESGDAAALVSRLLAVQPAVDRFFKRAQEPDPEKRLYNASMTAKINELHARHEQLMAEAQSRAASSGPAAPSTSAGATPAAASAAAVAEDAERAAAELREKEARRKAQEAEALAQRQREEAAKAAEVAAAVEKFKREQADKAAAKEAEKAAKETADKVRCALMPLRHLRAAALRQASGPRSAPLTALQLAHVLTQRQALSLYCRAPRFVCRVLRHKPFYHPPSCL
jgi:hypothetical protein